MIFSLSVCLILSRSLCLSDSCLADILGSSIAPLGGGAQCILRKRKGEPLNGGSIGKKALFSFIRVWSLK